MKNITLYSILLFLMMLTSCDPAKKSLSNLNIFPVEDDIRLGQQVSQEIESKPSEFPILPERGNEEAYRYIRSMTRNILNSGKVRYKNEFKWAIKIIDDDKTLNAFATPGGYIYVYTGLIKFLDTEDQLAGVLGHEIAHADRRHSTRQLTRSVGISVLIDAALGKSGAVTQIAQGLLSLKFSRSHETEADAYSVTYLCGTHDYNPSGAAGFFKKIGSKGSPPEFLSTHPNPTNRVQKIEQRAKELGCSPRAEENREYQRIKSLL